MLVGRSFHRAVRRLARGWYGGDEQVDAQEFAAWLLNRLRDEQFGIHNDAQPMVRWIAHTHPFNGPLSGTTQVSRYQKRKTNLDFTEARDSEWQWHQLGSMQVCTSLQTNNHASTPPLSFLQAGCPSCHPTNSVKALKAQAQCYT